MLLPITLASALVFAVRGNAQVDLGSASAFGIVAATTITNTGLSVVNGDVAITPNDRTSITGFEPGVVTGTIEAANARAAAVRADLQAAYTAMAAAPLTADLTGQDLGGQTLTSGVYGFSSSVGITGVLTLDGEGNQDSTFIFQIGSTITTASASSVVLINGARPCNVYFQVGSSATLGTGTTFAGSILALTSITGNAGVTVNGGLYALNAAVTLISDIINAPGECSGAVSPPSATTSSVSSTAVQSCTVAPPVTTTSVQSCTVAPPVTTTFYAPAVTTTYYVCSATASPTTSKYIPTTSKYTSSYSSTLVKYTSTTKYTPTTHKVTETKKDKEPAKTHTNCSCRGAKKPNQKCVCKGSAKTGEWRY